MKPLHVVLILSNVLWLVFVVSPYVSVLAPNSCDPRQTTPSPPASQDAPKDLAKDGPSYIEGASPGTSSTSSSSGPPSVERFRRDRDASWLDTPSFEHTRERVLKAHSIYRMKTPALACRGPQLGAPYQSGQWGLIWHEFNLEYYLGGAEEVLMASCAHFDPICAHWTDESLHELFFEHLYVPPHGIPTFEAMAERYGDRGVHVMQSISKADPKENRANRLGKHKGLTQIGIIFDGLISPGGDIFSQDVFIADMTRDVLVQEGKSRHYANTYEYAMCNQSAIPETDVVHVKEIAYIHHLHQMMFWHWLMDEWYRVFHFVPFLQRHVDIPIFVHSSSGFVERADTLNGRMFQVLNISHTRLIGAKYVKADVIYYAQHLDRFEVASLPLTQLVRYNMWKALGINRPWSALLHPSKRERVERFFKMKGSPELGLSEDAPLPLNVLFIVRTDPYKGRMVYNYPEVKKALLSMLDEYPDELLRKKASDPDQLVRESYVRINFDEHLPHLDQSHAFKLFSEADIIIGPHGAGLVNSLVARPGGHLIEFVGGGDWMNMLTSGRLGMSYHGFVGNLTTEGGMTEIGGRINYKLDPFEVTELVRSILDARFLKKHSL